MDLEQLQQELENERHARIAAESVIEEKQLQLQSANVELEKLNYDLDSLVEQRTAALMNNHDEAVIASQELLQLTDHLEELIHERTSEVVKARDKALMANKAKDEFLANMSHELRTPLHGILSYARFGKKKYKNVPREKLLDYFNKIEKSGQILLKLLDNLLDLAKLEAGKMSFSFQQHSLREIVDSAVDEFSSLLSEKKLTIKFDKPESRVQICFDTEKIKQVMRNLMSNAVKFSPECGKIRVRLEIKSTIVQVSVSDQGVGIPEDELDAVFNKFTQSRKTKTGAGGTGLGLSICREIIAAHKGKIWAENNPDVGAFVAFALPTNLET